MAVVFTANKNKVMKIKEQILSHAQTKVFLKPNVTNSMKYADTGSNVGCVTYLTHTYSFQRPQIKVVPEKLTC